jgi:hypothetical protein
MIRRAVALFCLILSIVTSAMAQAPPLSETPPPTGAPQPLAPPPAEQQSPGPQSPGSQTGEEQPGRVFCGQNVSFQVADPSAAPENYRRFLGVWSDAAWDSRTCAALIVQDVKPDGTASIIYVFGPQGSSNSVPGGVLHGTGVIRGGELRFQNSDSSQFAFRPGIVDMTGRLINPKGESFEATFKQTP